MYVVRVGFEPTTYTMSKYHSPTELSDYKYFVPLIGFEPIKILPKAFDLASIFTPIFEFSDWLTYFSDKVLEYYI